MSAVATTTFCVDGAGPSRSDDVRDGRAEAVPLPDVLVGVWKRFARFAGRPCRPAASQCAAVVHSNSVVRARIARAYEALPTMTLDVATLRAFDALRDEVREQFAFLTKVLGVHVMASEHDPYPSVHDVVSDLHERRLRVLATRSTGSHPYFGDDDNDMFRAVHDAFGHASTGRGFDRHGEEAAWAVHSAMFTSGAQSALATETRGQSAATIESGNEGFALQKVGLLPVVFASLGSLCSCIPPGERCSDR